MRLAHCLLASILLFSVVNKIETKSSEEYGEEEENDPDYGENVANIFGKNITTARTIEKEVTTLKNIQNVVSEEEGGEDESNDTQNDDDWSFNLDCISTEERALEIIGEVKICEVQNIKVTQRCYRMASASEHGDIEQVKGLSFSSPLVIHYIPRFMSSLARNLVSLEIEGCGLKSIERNELEQFPNLRYLKIQNNEIKWLDSNLFEFTSKLEFVVFNNNSKLAVIGSDILRPLKYLKGALFEFSGCIDTFGETPDDLANLKTELQVKCKTNEAKQMLTMIDVNTNLKIKVATLESTIARATGPDNLLGQKIRKLEENEKVLKAKLLETRKECAEGKTQLDNDAIKLEKRKLDQCMEDKTRLERLYGSCDQNVGSATKLLAPLVSHLAEHFDDKTEVDVICDKFSEETNQCVVVDLSVEFLETKISSVRDQNEIDVKPKSLIIRDQPILFLPTNLHEALPSLEQLEVSRCGLFTVERKTFQDLENLVTLNLTRNKIVSIANKSFDDLEFLTTLDLSFNFIESIEAASFEGLVMLKTLILNDNSIRVVANFLALVEALEELNLSGNFCIDMKSPETSLKAIEKEINEQCKAPKYFCCQPNTDSHVCHAESFHIEKPEISLLTKQKCNGISFKNVTELIIENHHINFLPNLLAETFPKLQKLVVLNSELTSITGSNFVGLGELRWIEIRNNTRLKVEPGTFFRSSQLEYLDLSSNQIQLLPKTIFKPLANLKTLILSNNNIKSLKAKNFPPKNLIKVFKMDNNDLTEIESKALRSLKKAEEIDLTGNKCIKDKFENNNKSGLTFSGFLAKVLELCEEPE